MRKEKGIAIIAALIMTSIMMVLAVTFAKIAFNQYKRANMFYGEQQAFYLCQLGFEESKVVINKRGNVWSAPNLHYLLPAGYNDIIRWFREGKPYSISRDTEIGAVRVVKKKGSNIIYIGSKTISKAEKYMELRYTYPPFKIAAWREI
ncbi:MAG: hypothetical protein V1843_01575 [bacterium]